MRKVNFLAILISILALNSNAFFNSESFSPFGNGTGYNSATPWSTNSNWNPMSTGAQYSPENDARNMSRYGAHPGSLKSYRQDPRFRSNSAMIPMPNQVQPSNWLKETDFSKTLEQIKNSGSKTFFVNEMPMSFDENYKNIQAQSQNIENAVKEQMRRYGETNGLTDNIYGKQGYSLSPAAASTSRVVSE